MFEQWQKIIQKNKRLAIGLMSGTSLDGIDAALVEIEGNGGNTKVELVEFTTLPFTSEERRSILELCDPKTSTVDRICEMNVVLGKKFAEAAQLVVSKSDRTIEEVDFISSHGQTIYHMPEKEATLQIGELAVIANNTGCVTVGDFRPSDMAAGGQGAPLVPFVDYLLFRSNENGRVLMNIGGIGNVTVIPAGASAEDTFAFDTGPGNMLIDAIVSIGTNGEQTYDHRGQIAAKGNVNEKWLNELIEADEYILLPPPKSTGRERYTSQKARELWDVGQNYQLTFEDITATITAYTAKSIAINFEKFIDPRASIEEVLVGGGGVHNDTLMNMLRQMLKRSVTSMDEWNFSSDAKEAVAFAILGNEFIQGNTNNLPSATGASRNVSMGKLVFP